MQIKTKAIAGPKKGSTATRNSKPTQVSNIKSLNSPTSVKSYKLNSLHTDRSERSSLTKKHDRLTALLLEKKQTTDGNNGQISDRRHKMPEREQRQNAKKGSRSSHSKEMVLNFKDRDKFANKYLLIGKKHTEVIEDRNPADLRERTVEIKLGTPRSESVEQLSGVGTALSAERRRSSKKVETKYLEISFNEKEKEAEKNNYTSQVSNIKPYQTSENNGP